MKIGTRIFFCYFLIFAVSFYYPISWVLGTLRVRYLEGVEDPLVDQANLLAAMVGKDMESGQFDPESLLQAFTSAYSRNLDARIYEVIKEKVDIRVYITDLSGKVIFDSLDKENVGKDYSKWRDVHLTLQGGYGARTTLENSEDPKSSVLYVAAPVFVNGRVSGVLTVAKPTTYINNFLDNAKPRIFRIGLMSAAAAIFLIYVVSVWITRPIKRLTHYAEEIGRGERPGFPKLDQSEIGEMGKAFERMKEALEGKRYVEQYVQNLTHEIKSPLSAIRGAAELLKEEMPKQQMEKFLFNIHNEANRIQLIIDRMLELSSLENLKKLQKMETISIQSLIKTILESKRPMMSKKGVTAVVNIAPEAMARGDSFLLHQAVSNLVQNAIDFSPDHGQVEIEGSVHDEKQVLEIVVKDQGAGIPDFAVEKIFQKFFSLQRPDTGKKSTGLGLNFVKEVASLHGGDVTLKNLPGKGVIATLGLPL